MTPSSRTQVIIVIAAALAVPSSAQTPPATIPEIEVENVVGYMHDIADQAKIATLPGIVPVPTEANRAFKWVATFGDIVAVNGKPARGS